MLENAHYVCVPKAEKFISNTILDAFNFAALYRVKFRGGQSNARVTSAHPVC